MNDIFEMIYDICIYIAVFGGPVSIVLLFVISLVKFIRTPKEDTVLRKERRFMLILMSSILGVLCLSILMLILSISMSNITFM